MLNGRRVEPDSTQPGEQRLRHVVEEMAIASGLPVPEIYVLDHERGINAFAAGHTRSDVALGVTRGCLGLLNRDELQGVIAHEFSHILSGDTRLNMRLMGVAHGILWPVIVGRVLVRGSSEPAEPASSVFDSQADISRLPFILIGYGLIGVGSFGLPFVRLLKSAICRNREWLADATAVQFTRYPAGIAGALKKIGGLYKQGRLDTPLAETASHLYFANSTFTPWLGFLSTHPPLAKRIQVLDPAFDGCYPKVSPLRPSQFERDQQYENAVAQIMEMEKAHPESPVAPSSDPTVRQIRQAAVVRLGLPAPLAAACRSPASSPAVIYSLLLNADDSIQASQLALLDQSLDPALRQQVQRLWPLLEALDPRVKLSLIDLALPALRHLDPVQYNCFRTQVKALIEADASIELFEYTLQKILFRHLRPYYEPTPSMRTRYASLGPLLPECSVLLSAIAHVGEADDELASVAFQRGAAYLDTPHGSVQFLTGEARSLARVDEALDRLTEASLRVRKNVLLACAQTVAADGRVLSRESELLRAIADAVDCPLPPFVEALQSQEPLAP
jgi:Zn-dependent protease with chaperone function